MINCVWFKLYQQSKLRKEVEFITHLGEWTGEPEGVFMLNKIHNLIIYLHLETKLNSLTCKVMLNNYHR